MRETQNMRVATPKESSRQYLAFCECVAIVPCSLPGRLPLRLFDITLKKQTIKHSLK